MANSIQELLIQANTALENALNDSEVQSLLTVFGYDQTAIEAGKSLYDSANQLQQKQLKEYGDQYSATEEFNTKLKAAKTEYVRFVKIARVALKNEPAAYQKLGLSGERKQSYSGWSGQVDQFYTNALADSNILAKLQKFGVTQEKLEAGKLLAEETKAANANQKKEMGEAQQATLSRDNAVDALSSWLSDFIAIARIALEEQPQFLEKLGILERS
jgi:hypothetical protein